MLSKTLSLSSFSLEKGSRHAKLIAKNDQVFGSKASPFGDGLSGPKLLPNLCVSLPCLHSQNLTSGSAAPKRGEGGRNLETTWVVWCGGDIFFGGAISTSDWQKKST